MPQNGAETSGSRRPATANGASSDAPERGLSQAVFAPRTAVDVRTRTLWVPWEPYPKGQPKGQPLLGGGDTLARRLAGSDSFTPG